MIISAFLYHTIKLKSLNRELLKLSTTDKLTGLYNRVKTDALLLLEKANADRYAIKSSILLIDVDLLKKVNDRYGHLIGDKVLIETSALFRQNVRDTDFVCRWGGDEFLIICPNTDINDAEVVADKLRRIIGSHCFSNDIHLTISIGIGQFSAAKSIEDTLSQADEALYQAKKKGRDQYVSHACT